LETNPASQLEQKQNNNNNKKKISLIQTCKVYNDSTKIFTLFLTHGLACVINGLRTENVSKIQPHVFSHSKQAHFSLKWDFFLTKNKNCL